MALQAHTVMDIKDWTLHRAIEVKVPWLRAVPARQEWILPLKKLVHFFLGPWLLVCQFIDISNQMETTGELSNIERIFLYNGPLYKFFCSTFDTSPVDSIWLEMSVNWHNKSQGPNKNVFILKEGDFTHVLLTLLVIRVVLLLTFYGVLNRLISQLYISYEECLIFETFYRIYTKGRSFNIFK